MIGNFLQRFKYALILFGLLVAIKVAVQLAQRSVYNWAGKDPSPENMQMLKSGRGGPALLFNRHGTILANNGAYEFVNKIEIQWGLRSDSVAWPSNIHMQFSRPFRETPLLMPMTENAGVKAVRGDYYAWDFLIYWKPHSDPTNLNCLYRIEVYP